MGFFYRNDELFCSGVSLAAVAGQVGTPCYVYSLDEIERRFRAFEVAFPQALVCYAYKANSSLAICSALARWGAGADVVSAGELFKARLVGTPQERIVFNGNGKTSAEIVAALDADILALSVDCREELLLVDELARARGRRARPSTGLRAGVFLRVNPALDPQTHPHVATGRRESQFGVPFEEVVPLAIEAQKLTGVDLIGLHTHIGSQIVHLDPFIESAQKLRYLVTELRRRGVAVAWLDIGGGLGIRYADDDAPSPAQWAEAVGASRRLAPIGNLGCRLVVEPGRSIVGPAGVLLARVVEVKRTPVKTFVVLDAGMNVLLRPALYGAHHAVQPVHRRPGTMVADVVGPICESGDVLAVAQTISPLERGDLVAVMDAGAYGFSMASRYNARPLPAEVVVRGNEFFVTRQAEALEDLVAGETIPPDITPVS